MKLYLISDTQLTAITEGQAHEVEDTIEEVLAQEVTVNQAMQAVTKIEANRPKGGAE